MAGSRRFSFRTIEELKAGLTDGTRLPLSKKTDILFEKLSVGGRTLANRIVYQPMEGCDASADGGPSEMTRQKYFGFAGGGPGLIWFEAVAIMPQARAQKNQLVLTEKNLGSFQRLVAETKELTLRKYGYEPVLVLQMTHSGRYSRPDGLPAPIVAYRHPLYEAKQPVGPECVIMDEGLSAAEEKYGECARLAQRAGFDGVDLKCCHGYLANELLSAYHREGPYGGSLQNRSRFLMNSFEAVRAATGSGFLSTLRLNVYDGVDYPYGFGASPITPGGEDLTEAIALVDELRNRFGLALLNVTVGNPYYAPHINRPYDNGAYVPEEEPMASVERFVRCTSQIQRAFPELCVVHSGLSYLRHLSPYLAAGIVESQYAGLAGFGRLALRYDDFAADLRDKGAIDPEQTCITCGACAKNLRAGKPAGCVVKAER